MRYTTYNIAERRYAIRDTRYDIRDTRYAIRDTRYAIRDTRYEIRDTRYEIRDTRHISAFTLVELLVALAITAILLTAVAFAFNASIINYRENEDMFKAINTARQSLFRITSQLRTAGTVDPDAPDNECTFDTADGENLTYRYDALAKTLYLITNDNTYKLCENVDTMTFTKNIVFDDDGNTKVRSVQIAISVASGGIHKKLAAAAVVRRNLD